MPAVHLLTHFGQGSFDCSLVKITVATTTDKHSSSCSFAKHLKFVTTDAVGDFIKYSLLTCLES